MKEKKNSLQCPSSQNEGVGDGDQIDVIGPDGDGTRVRLTKDFATCHKHQIGKEEEHLE